MSDENYQNSKYENGSELVCYFKSLYCGLGTTDTITRLDAESVGDPNSPNCKYYRFVKIYFREEQKFRKD